jgi:hypothetical protein
VDGLGEILKQIAEQKLSPGAAEDLVRDYFYRDLGHSKIDSDRRRRTGFPEVVYCAGKTPEQVLDIIESFPDQDAPILLTRLDHDKAEKIQAVHKDFRYNELGRVMSIRPMSVKNPDRFIAVLTAGTSDLAVAEEAAHTAETFGNRVERISDVGVAGIHRLMDKLSLIRRARVLVVAAGMEGALPSVVAGLVDRPVIALPTSVGYGASFGGLAALLAMLNSCASGISVVNIDNGFGAAYLASMINNM